MPYGLLPAGRGSYSVVNTSSGKVHSKHTTLEKAEAQMKLLRGIEHGMVPRGRTERKMNPMERKRDRTSSGTPLGRARR